VVDNNKEGDFRGKNRKRGKGKMADGQEDWRPYAELGYYIPTNAQLQKIFQRRKIKKDKRPEGIRTSVPARVSRRGRFKKGDREISGMALSSGNGKKNMFFSMPNKKEKRWALQDERDAHDKRKLAALKTKGPGRK